MRAPVALVVLVVVVGLALAACADDTPVDVAGTYTLNFARGENGCNLDNWTVGEAQAGVEVDLVHNSGSSEVNGTVKGTVGALVFLYLGTNMFSGRVSGREIDALLTSTYPAQMQGACTYKYQLHLTGMLNGDVLTGTLDITTATNGSADCGGRQDCHSLESFNGTRPPTTN
jgi:hypothetical protein